MAREIKLGLWIGQGELSRGEKASGCWNFWVFWVISQVNAANDFHG
jgi:hypothetical protein